MNDYIKIDQKRRPRGTVGQECLHRKSVCLPRARAFRTSKFLNARLGSITTKQDEIDR